MTFLLAFVIGISVEFRDLVGHGYQNGFLEGLEGLLSGMRRRLIGVIPIVSPL